MRLTSKSNNVTVNNTPVATTTPVVSNGNSISVNGVNIHSVVPTIPENLTDSQYKVIIGLIAKATAPIKAAWDCSEGTEAGTGKVVYAVRDTHYHKFGGHYLEHETCKAWLDAHATEVGLRKTNVIFAPTEKSKGGTFPMWVFEDGQEIELPDSIPLF